MASSIPLTGLAANDPLPGVYTEIRFAQGAASLGTNTYGAILIGNKTSAGSATVDTQVYGPTSADPLTSEADAITLFGTGSELHRMYRRFVAVNKSTPVYAIAVTESGGTAATMDFTFATTAAANGTLRLWVGDEFVDVAITSGDTIATIALAAVNAVNSKTHWAVTASRVTVTATNDTCRLTARQIGPRGNWLRGQAKLFSSGSIGTTVTNTSVAFFANGATADSNTTALSTIASARYYYQVSAAEDATQFGALVSQIDSLAAPTIGIRQRAFGASVDSSSNAITIATGRNTARSEYVVLSQCDWTPSELAANAAAVYALEEASFPFRCNFDGYGNDAVTKSYWKVPAPRSGAKPSVTTLRSFLNNGVTPIGVNADGSTYLVSRVTTRSLNGAVSDYRVRDAHKVTVCDRYADDLYNKCVAQFSGKLIADNPARGQTINAANTVTPDIIEASTDQLTREYGAAGLLQNVDQIIAATQVLRETSPTTRASQRVPLQPADCLHQIANLIEQVA